MVVGVVGTLAKLTKAITLRITTNKLYFILSERLINGGVGIWCEMLQVSHQLVSTAFLFSVMPCYCAFHCVSKNVSTLKQFSSKL